ncbi:MAG TPA: energy transducer TonB [Vicinamibacterales bacterium]|nr:energy transducer TonB [Vicinamibacterales bacterium]
MSTTTKREQTERSALPSSHLTVRPASDGPVEVRFLFDQPDGQRIGASLGAGLITHLVVIGIALLIMSLIPDRVYQAVLPDRLSPDIIWLSQPGPGGGGGGGNKMPDPPKKAELKGREKISVPTPPEPTPQPPKVEPPPETLNIPAQALAAATEVTPGALESTQASASTGSGTGSGAGPGQGSGLGPGFGGGTGGGAYRPGNGVQLPRPLQEVKPQYTADAMRAKVQGTVLLECVVLPDGTVGSVEVVRSLDSTFGLDQEAIKAAKRWRFAPGTRFGEPVAVLVTIELTFTLR